MTESTEKPDKSNVKARLEQVIKDVATFMSNASEEQQRTLLRLFEDWRLQGLLKDWQPGDEREAPRQTDSTLLTDAMRDRVLKDFIGDIGTGGMFIETPESFSVGQDIALIFSPTDGQGPVRITGKIAWRVAKGIGVRFATASNDLEEMIKSL